MAAIRKHQGAMMLTVTNRYPTIREVAVTAVRWAAVVRLERSVRNGR
jgi:hypothetical protein